MTEAPLTARVAGGLRWAVLDQVVTQLLRLSVTVVLTRLIAPGDFGLLAMALVFTQLATMLGDLGFGPALVQRKQIDKRHISTATVVTITVGAVLALAVAMLSGVIASFYDEADLAPVVVALSLTFLLRGISGVPKDLLRRDMQFRLVAVASIASVVLGATVGIVWALNGGGVSALVAYILIENVAFAVVVGAISIVTGRWRPRPLFNKAAFWDLARFGSFVTGTRLVHYGATNVDNLIVGKVLGATSLGLYNLGYRIMLVPILKVADVVANVTTPAFASVQDDTVRLQVAYSKAVQRIGLVCFPASAATLILAPYLVPVVFGADWLAAVVVVQILAINGVRLAIGRMSGVVYEATGRPHWDMAILSVTLVGYVFGFLVGVQYGIEGVAWAFTAVGYALVPIDAWLVHRALQAPAPRLWSGLVPVATATAVMSGAMLLTVWLLGSSSDVVVLSAGALCAAVVYLAALRLLMWPAVRSAISDLRS